MRSAMDVSLARLSTRIFLVAGAVVCAGALSFAAGRVWLAAHWAGTRNPADWARAAHLEPGNARYWSQIGLYEQWDFTNGNLDQALADFGRATRLDPHSDLLWMALAGAYEEAGRVSDARQAYQKALAAHPVSAEVAWRYGNFLLRQGETKQAAEQVHRALIDKPELSMSAVSQFWKAGAGLDLILDDVLPSQPAAYLGAVGFFISQQNDDAALAAWKQLSRLGLKVRLKQALGLINELIAHNRMDDAAEVWRQALASSGRTGEYEAGSLVFNGGFERDLVDGGFGWRQIPAPGTAFDLVSDVTHASAQSARVTFDGSANVDYSNLFQYVPITPGERYRFSAYMRTDSISTDSGPRFLLLSGGPGPEVAETPVMTGTHPWTKVEAEFSAGPEMHGLMVILRRAPSDMFANKIRGTVWVDGVRLEKVAPNGDTGR
jgi:tetratricopeptide (TPR) repeat protein